MDVGDRWLTVAPTFTGLSETQRRERAKTSIIVAETGNVLSMLVHLVNDWEGKRSWDAAFRQAHEDYETLGYET